MCRDCAVMTGRNITILDKNGEDVVIRGFATYPGKDVHHARGAAVGAAHVGELPVVWRVCTHEEADAIHAASRTAAFDRLARLTAVPHVLCRGTLCTAALRRHRLIKRGFAPLGSTACIVTHLVPGRTLA